MNMSMCKVCFSEIKKYGLYALRKDACICQKCFNELNPILNRYIIDGIEIFVIYRYDDALRNKLFELKGCYDIELSQIFLSRFIYELRLLYKGYTIVPLPSSKEDDEIRGFNHVYEIFKYLNLPIVNAIKKKYNFKQSELSKKERENILSKLEICDESELYGKKILIVDDVLTTGSSVKAAIKMIKKCHPKKIKVLILSRKIEIVKKKATFFTFKSFFKKRY